MSTPTLTGARSLSTQSPSGRHQRPDVCDAYRALWAMTRDERIAAMWRGELSLRQLCQWSSRAQHEVPLLGAEFVAGFGPVGCAHHDPSELAAERHEVDR